MARRLKDSKKTLNWPSIAIPLTLISESIAWASSEAIDGRFCCYSGMVKGEHRAVFRFSSVESATHFRLMFGGSVLES